MYYHKTVIVYCCTVLWLNFVFSLIQQFAIDEILNSHKYDYLDNGVFHHIDVLDFDLDAGTPSSTHNKYFTLIIGLFLFWSILLLSYLVFRAGVG